MGWSQLLESVCGYRRLRLTEGRRSCGELWDLYSSFATTGWRCALELSAMIECARALPSRGLADVNLCTSHARRRKVVAQWVAERRPDGPTLTIPKGADANSQELTVWVGTVLTASTTLSSWRSAGGMRPLWGSNARWEGRHTRPPWNGAARI